MTQEQEITLTDTTPRNGLDFEVFDLVLQAFTLIP